MAKKNKKAKIPLIILGVLVVTTGLVYYFNRPRFIRYPAFGISLPSGYSIHGIDVSHYQSAIDWEDVKAMNIQKVSIGFSFIKATEGTDDIDDRFRQNWKGARKAGIIRGAYHFFNPYKNGRAQALNFIRAVNLKPGDMPPVLDVEDAGQLSKAVLQQRVRDWLVTVEQHYKVKPLIYTGADFYKFYLADTFDHYPLWVAHYLAKDRPRVKREWNFWQHNEAGRVNGISSYVDFNVFNGDSVAFQNLLYK
ncbi:MAG: GH25 family lysozyme [Ferruginibacter sp.]